MTRKAKSDSRKEFVRHRSREWHIQFTLPWEVWVSGRRVARFRDERDARGFTKARYGAAAEIINMQNDEHDKPESADAVDPQGGLTLDGPSAPQSSSAVLVREPDGKTR